MVMCLKWCVGLLFLAIVFVDADNEIDNNDEVLHLIGDPDFRDVSLRWEYERQTPPRGMDERHPRLYGFQVHYCEIQAWGLHRCRTKVIEHPSDDKPKASGGVRRGRAGGAFTARIGGLRMATTYTFEVRPLQLAPDDLADSQSIGKSIIVPTKGFSAKATQCLPHASEVQVSTGPYFGGRIAVEAVDGRTERCGISGNPNSAQDTYTLRIDHEECGSEVNDTTVATYVIVQENLPILTHSTRRFLVLCTYKPETLTVRAGINLPSSGGANLQYYKPHSGSVEPFDSQEIEYNEVQPARLEARMMSDGEESVAGPVVLVVFLVLAGFAAVALLIWRLIPQGSDDNSTISIRSQGKGTGLFGRFNRRYQDSISDTGSIYSITLSDRADYQHRKVNTDCDNTSEA